MCHITVNTSCNKDLCDHYLIHKMIMLFFFITSLYTHTNVFLYLTSRYDAELEFNPDKNVVVVKQNIQQTQFLNTCFFTLHNTVFHCNNNMESKSKKIMNLLMKNRGIGHNVIWWSCVFLSWCHLSWWTKYILFWSIERMTNS